MRPLYEAIRAVMARHPAYRYEHIFVDNCSQDGTRAELRALCAADPNVKAIFNTRNFGDIRSFAHGLRQTSGVAVIALVCDFQDPPELIDTFIARWKEGHKVVLGVKTTSAENPIVYRIRRLYYGLLQRIAEAPPVPQTTGFGLYDRVVIDAIQRLDDPYPFFRGQVSEVGYPAVHIPFRQPMRRAGRSSQTLYSLYNHALLGIINHSKVPLRLATMTGFLLAALSSVVGLGYFLAKILFWDRFSLGIAPVLIGFFLLTSVQLIFIGILGEYIGIIWTHVRHVPPVFEQERINC